MQVVCSAHGGCTPRRRSGGLGLVAKTFSRREGNQPPYFTKDDRSRRWQHLSLQSGVCLACVKLGESAHQTRATASFFSPRRDTRTLRQPQTSEHVHVAGFLSCGEASFGRKCEKIALWRGFIIGPSPQGVRKASKSTYLGRAVFCNSLCATQARGFPGQSTPFAEFFRASKAGRRAQ